MRNFLMKKILVVSLVYNKKQFLSDCVMSVANQTLSKDKYMHLLFDNNSTDGAERLCDIFAKKFNHIRVVHMNKNLGQMPAYNWILREWIPKNMPNAEIECQVDSDDMLTPIALSEVEKKFVNKEIGHAYSDFNIISAMGHLKIQAHPKAKQVEPKIELSAEGQKILRMYELRFNSIGHLRSMRVSALNEIDGFDETYKYATDMSMSCRMLSSRFKVVKIPKILYQWREHGMGQIQAIDSKLQTDNAQNIIKFYAEKWKKEGLL